MPPQDNSPRRTTERTQMATDEIVSYWLLHLKIIFIIFTGDGTFQETNAKVINCLCDLFTYRQASFCMVSVITSGKQM